MGEWQEIVPVVSVVCAIFVGNRLLLVDYEYSDAIQSLIFTSLHVYGVGASVLPPNGEDVDGP